MAGVRILIPLTMCVLISGIVTVGVIDKGLFPLLPLYYLSWLTFRLATRTCVPTQSDGESLTFQGVLGKASVTLSEISHMYVTHYSPDWSKRHIIIVLPGHLNYYYTFSDDTNNLIDVLNENKIEKRKSFLLCGGTQEI